MADGAGTTDDASHRVTVPRASLAPFRRLSLYNSPYPAHAAGHAVDLYPDSNDGVSPVAGEVMATRTVRTPQRPYAAEHDHLVLVACDDEWCAAAGTDPVVARILHVDPSVEAGDVVAVGDSLGEMVRSGFFAPWVDNHVHLGFRTPDQHLERAAGSLPLSLPVTPTPLAWDGTGTVVETGETFVVLDRPVHPGPDHGWCGLAADASTDATRRRGVLDGGFPHYDGGGFLRDPATDTDGTGAVSLLDAVVGDRAGRTVTWRPRTVRVNDHVAVGLSLFLACDGPAGVKVVCPDHALEPGAEVTVRITDD